MADPFTTAVIQAALEAAADEMFHTLRKTAMSPIIYEVLDVGTGVTDADGALVSSGAGIPSFVGVLDKSISAIIDRYGSGIVEGDVFITNDPNHGGVTHLNDIVVAEPVFHEGLRIAWVASIAHWGDIGGKTPGSMPTDVTEIVAEGLRLPMVRLFKGGVRNEAVYDIISVNSRQPEVAHGDLWAQVSAGRRAAALIRRLVARYGAAEVTDAIQEAQTTGEARARAGLALLPTGDYSINEPQDDGTVWTASIHITKEAFTVDLRDAPRQASGPHNTSRDGSVIVCQMLFKSLTDSTRDANAGSFAPLKVRTKPGTIFDAGPDAPHGYYFETRIRLFDMLWHCLSRAMPTRLPAGHFASIFGTVIAGQHPETGRRYTMVEPQMGGWGATADRPGLDAMYSSSHGDTFNCPVEVAEARYGLSVEEKSLTNREEGDGLQPGGRGVRTRYQLRAPASLSVGLSHARTPVWSVGDAPGGGRNSIRINRSDGRSEDFQFASGVRLNPDDEVEIETAFGGSYSPA